MHKIIVYLLSVGFYIYGALYCYERGFQILDLVLKEYEEYYGNDLEVRRIELATAVVQTTGAANEVIRDIRVKTNDPSLDQIQQNIIEQRQIYKETMHRIDTEKQHFMQRSNERRRNAQSAYREAYLPVAVFGGVIWYLLSLPLCGLLISILSIFRPSEMTADTLSSRHENSKPLGT